MQHWISFTTLQPHLNFVWTRTPCSRRWKNIGTTEDTYARSTHTWLSMFLYVGETRKNVTWSVLWAPRDVAPITEYDIQCPQSETIHSKQKRSNFEKAQLDLPEITGLCYDNAETYNFALKKHHNTGGTDLTDLQRQRILEKLRLECWATSQRDITTSLTRTKTSSHELRRRNLVPKILAIPTKLW